MLPPALNNLGIVLVEIVGQSKNQSFSQRLVKTFAICRLLCNNKTNICAFKTKQPVTNTVGNIK